MTTTPTTKIVIVSGQEFSVPAETDNEQIRQQLTAMGFADAASATIQIGKKTVGDTDYTTIEFVKKAGTKGLDGAELAALLALVPADALPPCSEAHPLHLSRQVRALTHGALTFGEAVEDGGTLIDALEAHQAQAHHDYTPVTKRNGGHTCQALAHLPPAAASVVPSGW